MRPGIGATTRLGPFAPAPAARPRPNRTALAGTWTEWPFT
jgi:hypothetical protein